MRVKRELNNQQSFGMAYRANRQALRIIAKRGMTGEYLRVKPQLEKMAEKTDITLVRNFNFGFPDSLNFVATPINKLKINNAITRGINYLMMKSGKIEAGYQFRYYAHHAEKALNDIIELKKQQTSETAFKTSNKALRIIAKYDMTEEYLKAKPELKEMAQKQNVNLTLTGDGDSTLHWLNFVANPTNRLEINNAITRGINYLRMKSGRTEPFLTNLNKKDDYIFYADQAAKALKDGKKLKNTK